MMKSRIRELDAVTTSQIAAGEVVERPASVIKELCENALDAGANVIEIEIERGGIRRMSVRDNGEGMDEEDSIRAFLPHATSKLRDLSDLEMLDTMGFRGEALPSIASVSRITLLTRREEMANGVRVELEGGDLIDQLPAGCAVGSCFEVRDLFYNTPARFKFLKTDRTEGMYITRIVTDLALARPDVSFRLSSDGNERLHTPGNGDLLSVIYSVFGQETADQMIPVPALEDAPVQVSGYVGRPEISRRSRQMQYFMVNRRPVHSALLVKAVEQAFTGQTMSGKFPVAILNVRVSPSLVDVNVHPQKSEIRFWDEQKVFRACMQQVQGALHTASGLPDDPTPMFEQRTTPAPPEEAVEAASAAWRNQSLNAWTSERTRTDQSSASNEAESVWETKAESVFTYKADDKTKAPLADFGEPTAEAVRGKAADAREDKHTEAGIAESGNTETETTAIRHELFDRLLREAKYIGQVFTTYLLFELEGELILIDQHAAHEKLLYEKLMHRFNDKHELEPQSLLTPFTLRLSPEEFELLEEKTELTRRLGFELDPLGHSSLAIRAIPASKADMDPEDAVRALIDDLHVYDFEILQRDAAKQRHMLATVACKAAVKGRDRLSGEEVRSLLIAMREAKDPWRCPHGRPSVIRIPEKDLEKAFQRIVN